MEQQPAVRRRRLLSGVLAGGVLGASGSEAAQASAGAKAAATPALVRAKKLRPGDLIVGPGGSVVRVASVDRLPSGRRRVRYTDPYTGATTPLSDDADRTGFAARFRFVVLERKVGAASVRLTGSPAPRVIDGGGP